MRVSGWKLVSLGPHAANFGGFRYCGSRNKTFIC